MNIELLTFASDIRQHRERNRRRERIEIPTRRKPVDRVKPQHARSAANKLRAAERDARIKARRNAQNP